MLALHAASMTFSAPPTRPTLLKTFNASVSGYSWATGALNASLSGRFVFSEADAAQLQSQVLPDGRTSKAVLRYNGTTAGPAGFGVFALQPFFDSHVCFVYPLPEGYPGQAESFELALEEAWCQQAAPCMAEYQLSTYSGAHAIAGVPCQLWQYTDPSPSLNDTVSYCVTDEGHVLSVNRSYSQANVQVDSRVSFSDYKATVPASAFAVADEKSCVDLRPIEAASGGDDAPVNDPERIARVNAEAGGAWVAAASAVFDGYTQRDAAQRLGLSTAAFDLPPPSEAHRAALAAVALPAAFDAREQWGAQCASVRAVRNQGDCGGCWAFSAAETLADRFCIASVQQAQQRQQAHAHAHRQVEAGAAAAAAVSPYANISLAPQFILDCDTTDLGCGGGLLDDAWRYLTKAGAVAEACDPYKYCAHPASPSCEVGPHPPRPTPSQGVCPTQCADGSPLQRYKAASAYAVARPGDVEAIQREIFAHGSVQVLARSPHPAPGTGHDTRTPHTTGRLPGVRRLHDVPQRHLLPHQVGTGPTRRPRRQARRLGRRCTRRRLLDRRQLMVAALGDGRLLPHPPRHQRVRHRDDARRWAAGALMQAGLNANPLSTRVV